MQITHKNYVVRNKVFKKKNFSDPFSPEVNKAVKDQQRGTQSFDGMSLNNLKGL